jgi:hypothetical protein
MSKTICKILDDCQYYNSERKTFTQSNWKGNFLLTDKHNLQIFDAFDCVEHDTKTNDEDFYFVPFFYLNEGKEKTLDNIVNVADSFIQQYKRFFDKKNVWFLINDMWEPTNYVESFQNILKTIHPTLKTVLVTANKSLTGHDIIYSNIWMKRFPALNEPIDYIGPNLYINLNRVPRFHRCFLIEELNNENLLRLGYNTLAFKEFPEKFDAYLDEYPNTNIPNQKFDILDVNDFKNENPNDIVPLKHCRKSFLYITTETVVDSEKLFFSEKTYKPLAIGMPFMLLGNPGTLQELREQGFITFAPWWDENYDLDLSLENRVKIITKNLRKLSEYSVDDLKHIRSEMAEVVGHNQNLYRVLKRKNYLSESIRVFAHKSQL